LKAAVHVLANICAVTAGETFLIELEKQLTDEKLVDALITVLNALAQCREFLEAGDLQKAKVEIKDPLLKKAIDEVQLYVDAAT
jgi:hypothetical protein